MQFQSNQIIINVVFGLKQGKNWCIIKLGFFRSSLLSSFSEQSFMTLKEDLFLGRSE